MRLGIMDVITAHLDPPPPFGFKELFVSDRFYVNKNQVRVLFFAPGILSMMCKAFGSDQCVSVSVLRISAFLTEGAV